MKKFLVILFCTLSQAQDFPIEIAPFFDGYNLKAENVSLDFITSFDKTIPNSLPFPNREGKYLDSTIHELVFNSFYNQARFSYESDIDFYSKPLSEVKKVKLTRVYPFLANFKTLVKQKLILDDFDSILISSLDFYPVGFWKRHNDNYLRLSSSTASLPIKDLGFSLLDLGIVLNPNSYKYHYISQVDGLVPYVEYKNGKFMHAATPVLGQQKFVKRKLYKVQFYNSDFLSEDYSGELFFDSESFIPVYKRVKGRDNQIKYFVYIISEINNKPFISGAFVKNKETVSSFYIKEIKEIEITAQKLEQLDPNYTKQ